MIKNVVGEERQQWMRKEKKSENLENLSKVCCA